jgi:hypothetical protein
MGDLKKPKDGGGIKWSTLKRKVRKVTLENGDEVVQSVSGALYYPPDRAIYFGYEVELEKEVTVGDNKVSKIQVWVLDPKTAPPPGAIDHTGWCHGLTFDETIYSPAGNEVPAILAAGWSQIECKSAKKGDVIVYYDAVGNVTHSATSNGDGTYTSKAGLTPQKNNETEAAMNKTYSVPPGTTKCYTKNISLRRPLRFENNL